MYPNSSYNAPNGFQYRAANAAPDLKTAAGGIAFDFRSSLHRPHVAALIMEPGTPLRRRNSPRGANDSSANDSFATREPSDPARASFLRQRDLVAEAAIRQRMEALRARLAALERFTVNPNGRFMRRWDKLMMMAIAWTATVTPFEIAFFIEIKRLAEHDSFEWARFGINRSIDAIFVLDIIMTFFVPFRESPRKVRAAAAAALLACCSAGLLLCCCPPRHACAHSPIP